MSTIIISAAVAIVVAYLIGTLLGYSWGREDGYDLGIREKRDSKGSAD